MPLLPSHDTTIFKVTALSTAFTGNATSFFSYFVVGLNNAVTLYRLNSGCAISFYDDLCLPIIVLWAGMCCILFFCEFPYMVILLL